MTELEKKLNGNDQRVEPEINLSEICIEQN